MNYDGKIRVNTEIETKSFDAQIKKLKSDIERYKKTLESDATVPVHLRMSEDEKRDLEATIEKLKNQLISLENQANLTGNAGAIAGDKSGSSFENAGKKLKKFGG